MAPFFLRRVFGVETKPRLPAIEGATKSWKRKAFDLLGGVKLVERLGLAGKAQFLIDLLYCNNCSFVSPVDEIPGDLLSALYIDYRQSRYDSERTWYEPNYSDISGLIGGEAEAMTRKAALDRFLSEHITDEDRRKITSVLDWGGADGRFLPELFSDKPRYVFEVSDQETIEGILRLERIADSQFSYIQMAHLLEHVSNPLQLIIQARKCLHANGLMYVEVPLEVGDEEILKSDLQYRKRLFMTHEHINFFTETSVRKLLESAEFDPIAVQIDPVRTALGEVSMIRGLGVRN